MNRKVDVNGGDIERTIEFVDIIIEEEYERGVR